MNQQLSISYWRDMWVWGVPAVALMLAILVWWQDANRLGFILLNRFGLLSSDVLWANITIVGDTLVALVICLPFIIRRPEIVWAGILAALVAMLFTHSLKPLLEVVRPAGVSAEVLAPDLIHIIGPALTQYSFPSGHTTTAFTLAGVIILKLNQTLRQRWAAFILISAMVVGLSRAVVGVHWPLDILAGAAGGWLAAAVGVYWGRFWRWGEQRNGQFWLLLLLLLCAFILLFHDTNYEQAFWGQYLILFASLWFFSREFLLYRDYLEFPTYIATWLHEAVPRTYTHLQRYALNYAILVFFILFVQWWIGWGMLLQAWTLLSWPVFLLAITLVLLSYILRAVRLWDYFHPLTKTRFSACLRLMLWHNFFNNLLPMRAGEISFPVLMLRYFQVPVTQSVAGLLWFRLLDLHALAGIAWLALGTWWWNGLVTIILWFLWLSVPYWLFRFQKHYLVHWQAQLSEKWYAWVEKIIAGSPHHIWQFWRLWFWTQLNWVAKLGVFAWLLYLFSDTSFAAAGMGAIMGELTSVLPIHSVAGFGTYEAGVVAGLAPFDVNLDTALLAAVNLHLFLLSLSILTGGIAWWWGTQVGNGGMFSSENG